MILTVYLSTEQEFYRNMKNSNTKTIKYKLKKKEKIKHLHLKCLSLGTQKPENRQRTKQITWIYALYSSLKLAVSDRLN